MTELPLAPEEPKRSREEEGERGSRWRNGQGGSQTANDIGVRTAPGGSGSGSIGEESTRW